jgi:PAS domain-containing protein
LNWGGGDRWRVKPPSEESGRPPLAQGRRTPDAQALRAILDAAVDTIITIDECRTLESLNPSAARLFGYAMTRLIGRNVNMLMPDPHRHLQNRA